MHCVNGSFPGINRDGGFAEFLLTSARSVVKLDPSLHPTQIAALADAGLTAIHAVKKAIPVLGAGTKAVVIGAGGLGHIGIQCLKAYTPTEIIVVDPNEKALELARELGADETVKVEGSSHIDTVKELTDGVGAEAIIECSALEICLDALEHLRDGFLSRSPHGIRTNASLLIAPHDARLGGEVEGHLAFRAGEAEHAGPAH
jgi:NAD+-dependent secondary alcohol dehydrogenase Adh1